MGLSQSNVACIFQDSRGFMWFGTREGLNKYDGYKFTVYKHNAENANSPSHNSIMDIAEDEDGNIWIATWGGGLNMFNWRKERFTHYRLNAKDASGINGDFISKLFKDSDGNLWIGTEGGGLNLYDKKSNEFIRYMNNKNDSTSLSDDWVRDITEDASHNLWISTNTGGLNLFDKKTKTFRHFQHDDNNSKSVCSNAYLTIFVDSKNQLWIGSRGQGLDLFDRINEEFIHFRHDPFMSNSLSANTIRDINEDENGNIWIGTENGGLSIFNVSSQTFDNYLKDDADKRSLNTNTVWSLFRDNKGNMWIGTFSAGINIVSRDANKFIHYRHSSSPVSLNNNNVLTIFEDSMENLWIGTDGGGLNLFDNKKGSFTSYKHDPFNKNSLTGNYILEVFEDSDGDLWIGTWGDGITVFNKKKNKFKHINKDLVNPNGLNSSNVWTIAEDAAKNVWIGTYDAGLSQYDREKDNFIHYRRDQANPQGLSNDYINLVFKDRKGNLWVGTNGTGLDLFNEKTKTFTHFPHDDGKNSISNNDVYCMAEDKKGDLWIGTGLGLNRLDSETGLFTSYFIKDGLPSNTIAGLLFDQNGNLWISTYNGISRFNPATKRFKNFGINDGLQSNEFKMNSCYKSRSGQLFFGGINGFNGFYPDSIKEKRYEPSLVLTDFQVFNKQVQISQDGESKNLLNQSITDTRKLTLSYDQSVITFEFASLNYAVQDKRQYSYMLKGFDNDWNDIGTRHTATYTNLDPGKYIFKVRGLNNEGNWSSNIVKLEITITPPFWLTWWFRIIVVLAVAGIIIGIYRVRVNALNRQREILQQKVKEQTIQLVQSNREEQKARLEADKANIELEKKNIELEQFVYIASHDLREPLRTTTGFVELFRKQYHGILDQKADKYLSYITQASGRMKTLIDDLLDYSRAGSKNENQHVDCNVILQEVLADLGIALSEAGAEVRSDHLPVIIANPTGIKQLFQNLISNGIKFRKKDVNPKINIYSEIKDGNWIFSFSDNGIGIEQKNMEKIFVIFQRLHNRQEYEGSGIGLAHCKKIVDQQNGKIWAVSQFGDGTTFYFSIPQTIPNKFHE